MVDFAMQYTMTVIKLMLVLNPIYIYQLYYQPTLGENKLTPNNSLATSKNQTDLFRFCGVIPYVLSTTQLYMSL